jgi:hypothetical protein
LRVKDARGAAAPDPASPGPGSSATALIKHLQNAYSLFIESGAFWRCKIFAPGVHKSRPVGPEGLAKGAAVMVTFNSSLFWFVPVILAVAFMLWVLYMFWREGHRPLGR